MPKKLKFKVHRFDTLGSTMDTAKKMAEVGAKEGTVVIADEQTRGRGRDGRTWESPLGGLYLSMILRPEILVFEAHKLLFLTGNAVAETIRKYNGERVEIKWPNDLCIANQKVGGLLCETSSLGKNLRYAVMGIGVNTNITRFPSILEGEAVSLHQISGMEIDNNHLAEQLMEEISERYEGFPRNFRTLLEEWKELCNTLGREVRLNGERVRAIDIDDEGFLIVLDEEGRERKIVSGRIEYL